VNAATLSSKALESDRGLETEWQVPTHTVDEFRTRATRECVIVFVLNEGERLIRQLERMQPWITHADILVADGGSVPALLPLDGIRRLGVRALLRKTGAGKLSAQMRMAFAYALDEGYEGIVTIDGNDKDDPSAIPLFIELLRAGVDHVQGSRFIRGGRHVRTPLHRLLAVRLVHAPLISLAAGRSYTDTTNGFRAYSPRLLRDPRVAPFRDVFSRYELHYYLAIRAARLGYRVAEVPVTRAYPASGPTPTKISPIRGSLSVLRQLIAACLHRFDPPRQTGDSPSRG
jgi:dolichol-phosphate mannosyltransferase